MESVVCEFAFHNENDKKTLVVATIANKYRCRTEG